jgi:hypothetical protein
VPRRKTKRAAKLPFCACELPQSAFAAQFADGSQLRTEHRQFGLDSSDFLLALGILAGFLGAF